MLPALMEAEAANRSVELVADLDRLQELAEPWRALAVARENAFVTPDWYLTWWRHYADGHQPAVIAVHGPDSTLTGVVPFVIATERPRTVRFAGSALGDHFHPVCEPGDEASVAAAAATALEEVRSRWSFLILENVDADASWWHELARPWTSKGQPLEDRRSRVLCAELRGKSWQAYTAGRSRNLRSQLSRKRRRLGEEHQVSFRWTRDAATVREDMATMFRLHDWRWRERPGGSSMTSDRARAFHSDFAAVALERGWLRLCFLELDSEPAAAWYGWRVGGRFAYYQAGFDPRFAAHSVGLLLMARTVEAAIDEGADLYDMLLGEEPFKERFANSEREVVSVAIAGGRASRALAVAERALRRGGRRLPTVLRDPLKRGAQTATDRLPLARRR